MSSAEERQQERIESRNRMDFENGRRLNTANNREILSYENTSSDLTRDEVRGLLADYRPFSQRELDNYNVSQKGTWFRAIKFNPRTGRLIKFVRGGFLIKKGVGDNGNPFVVFLNSSLGFTFSESTNGLQLFIRVPNVERVNPRIDDFVNNYSQIQRQQRPNVLVSADLNEVHFYKNYTELSTKKDDLSKSSVDKKLFNRSRADDKITSRKSKKTYFLLYVTENEKDQFNDELRALRTLPLQVNPFANETEDIIRQFY